MLRRWSLRTLLLCSAAVRTAGCAAAGIFRRTALPRLHGGEPSPCDMPCLRMRACGAMLLRAAAPTKQFTLGRTLTPAAK